MNKTTHYRALSVHWWESRSTDRNSDRFPTAMQQPARTSAAIVHESYNNVARGTPGAGSGKGNRFSHPKPDGSVLLARGLPRVVYNPAGNAAHARVQAVRLQAAKPGGVKPPHIPPVVDVRPATSYTYPMGFLALLEPLKWEKRRVAGVMAASCRARGRALMDVSMSLQTFGRASSGLPVGRTRYHGPPATMPLPHRFGGPGTHHEAMWVSSRHPRSFGSGSQVLSWAVDGSRRCCSRGDAGERLPRGAGHHG